jgi:rare lipoprotein A
MDSTHAIELSPAAAQQLGVGSDAAVRVRRVNPSEAERALLRLGHTAPERMATPKPLLAVLQRRLATDPAAAHAGASLAQAVLVPAAEKDDDDDAPAVPAAKAPAPRLAKAEPKPMLPKPVLPKAAPRLPPRLRCPAPAPALPRCPRRRSPSPSPHQRCPPAVAPKPAEPKPAVLKPQTKPEKAPDKHAAPGPVAGGHFVVQVGAFGDQARAQGVATRVGAHLSSAGKLWRVRMGPYSTQSDAQAALAKARAAGYTEARPSAGMRQQPVPAHTTA